MALIKRVVRWLARHRLVRAAVFAAGAVVVLVVVANLALWRAGRGHIVNDSSELAGSYDAVIIPGARVWQDEQPSLTLQARIDAAVELHELGIVDHLLASGDNGSVFYDEPTIIRRTAHLQGVPLDDITLDYAGFSTWDTCVRAKEIFGVDRAVFVTQARFANRSAALCEAAGIDVDVLSLGNQRGISLSRGWRAAAREPIAAVKGLYETIARPEPHLAGEFIGLIGSEGPANPDPVLGEN